MRGGVVCCDWDNVLAGQEVGVDPHPYRWTQDHKLLADLHLYRGLVLGVNKKLLDRSNDPAPRVCEVLE